MPAALTTAPDDAVPATPAAGSDPDPTAAYLSVPLDADAEATPALPQPDPFPSDDDPADPQGPIRTAGDNGMEEYRRLQRRLLLATAWASAIVVPLTAVIWDPATAASLLVGSLAGLLYLRLLARSVSRLGVNSKSVGKVQLLVPITLVLAAARIPQLQMLPALLGFLLYKPALILQAVLDG
ncbi:MAG: ATP synthase subunit I [Synechococcaceae cyanobacterium]|nr:ATP synthase subunit I [Synechococcaceae cyanobacterium]